MKALTINLPESLDSEEFEIKMLLAGQLYERGKVTIGQAAEITGISKRSFIEMMGKFGFSLFSESSDDLKSDILNA
jgi:predicted HTH domain antitoxin